MKRLLLGLALLTSLVGCSTTENEEETYTTNYRYHCPQNNTCYEVYTRSYLSSSASWKSSEHVVTLTTGEKMIFSAGTFIVSEGEYCIVCKALEEQASETND